ncbi:MAG: methyltransferase [Pseudomonadales bacterium]|jgi:methylene-fatty-acyl-phospholipid synthase|nr:methyltransferase [Pseudomonadales bacterium]
MSPIVWLLPLSVLLLGVERLAYYLIWRYPGAFEEFCEGPLARRLGDPVDVLQKAFYLFKVVQIAVFAAWCFVFDTRGPVPLPTEHVGALVAGTALILFGQTLNALVFRALGKTGVFYGNRFGRDVPWVEGFPFSTFRHPQYVGAALSVWGFFLVMRFPEPDWFLLPLAQTGLYLVSVVHEQRS